MKNDYSDIRASIYASMKCIYNPVVEQPIIVDINRQGPERDCREICKRVIIKMRKNESFTAGKGDSRP